MDQSLPSRFWSKVDRHGPTADHMDTRCWVWTGSYRDKKYGSFHFNGKTWAAHRVAFLLHYGEEPEMVLHRCDNKRCVRPDHLYGGDAFDNFLDVLERRNNGPVLRFLGGFKKAG